MLGCSFVSPSAGRVGAIVGPSTMSGSNASDLIGQPSDRRKLIAVVYADMVGYSRLIGLDDAGTLQRLRRLRGELIDPAIEKHGGRIVQTGGDSLLIVFDSIDGAVRCAIEVQQKVPIHDGDQAPDRTIRFRVGINIGDAIADGTDLHGDAVNVVARLQAECPPGGICVTRAVRDHVQDRLNLTFEELGALKLKNITRPVEAFLVRPPATLKSVERTLVQDTGEALPLPGKPSLAVLSFTNMSGDLDQEFFSDGITDDIITELSRSRSLFVIARNSSFTYKGRAVDVRRVARELGVRYVLEGSVRRNDKRVRVVAQLIDAETGNHILAERYDRDLTDVFAIQDEITAAVTTAILPAVTDAEQQRALRKPPASLSAWETYQRAIWHMGKGSGPDNEQARILLGRAISLDARFAPAYLAIALTHIYDGNKFAAISLQEAARLATDWAKKAAEIDVDNSDAISILELAKLLGNNRVDKENVFRLRAANPNSLWPHTASGIILVFSGQPSQGRAALLDALRLSPYDPINRPQILTNILISHYFEHDYLAAFETASFALSRHPGVPNLFRWKSASLGQLGRADEARDALLKALEVSPQSFDLFVRSRPSWFRPEDHEHMLDGLRKAGWQG